MCEEIEIGGVDSDATHEEIEIRCLSDGISQGTWAPQRMDYSHCSNTTKNDDEARRGKEHEVVGMHAPNTVAERSDCGTRASEFK